MDRRAFLAAAGIGAASGCVGLGGQLVPVPYAIHDFTVSTDKLYPSHPYHFRVKRFLMDPADTDKEPLELSDLNAELREVVRQIVGTDRAPGFHDPPAGLITLVDQHVIECPARCAAHDYVELTYAHTDPSSPPVAELSAETFNKLWTSGIRVSLGNPSDHPLVIESGVAPPFSILHAVGIDGTAHAFPLWSDTYAEDKQISFRGDEVLYPDVGRTFEVPSTSGVTRSYRLSYQLADGFVTGRYVVSSRADASTFVFGEKTNVPFVVKYTGPGLPGGELVAFRIEFELRRR